MSIKIRNSSFHDNDTAISVPENAVVDIENTQMVRNKKGIEVRSDINELIHDLTQEIFKSNLGNSSKENLVKQILEVASSQKIDQKDKAKINSLLSLVGQNALDLFTQILAIVITSKTGF